MNDSAKSAALEIIGMLADRRGFDGWWYGIDNGIQQEIVEKIAEIIDKEHTP